MSDTFGRSSLTPFAYYDPDSSCWRTSQGTFLLDSMLSSVTLPPSGSMHGGALYERPTLALATDEPGSLLLLATPVAGDGLGGGRTQESLRAARGADQVVWGLREQVRLLPTPAVNDMGEGKTLEWWDDWTEAQRVKHGNGNGHGKSLAVEALRMLPTPRAQNEEGRNSRVWLRPADQPQNLENALAHVRLVGVTTNPPSDDTNEPSDEQLRLL